MYQIIPTPPLYIPLSLDPELGVRFISLVVCPFFSEERLDVLDADPKCLSLDVLVAAGIFDSTNKCIF